MRLLLTVVFIASISLSGIANTNKNIVDSLIIQLKRQPKDSNYVNQTLYLSSYYFEKNLLKSNLYANRSLKIADSIKYDNGIARALFLLGQTEHKKGDLTKALNHYKSAANKYQIKKDFYFLGKTFAETGNIYADLGEMVKAIKFHQAAVNIFEEINNESAIAFCFTDLGRINRMQKNYDKSLEYYQKAKAIFKKSKDEMALARLYNQVSVVFREKNDIEKSLSYDFNALYIQERLRDKSGMAQSNLNIGETSVQQKEYTRAQGYVDYAGKLYREIEDQIGITKCYLLTARIAQKTNKFSLAKQNLEKSIEIAEKAKAIPQLVDAYKTLGDIYAKEQNFEKAFKYLTTYELLRDTLYSLEKTRQFSEMEIKFQTENIEKELKVVNEEKEIEANKAFTFTLSFFLGLGIFIIIVILLRKRNKESQDNNKKLERKNQLIEKKNNEILDSILYAKRIQQAMLTSTNYINDIFDEYLIFYRPKDIVSGDFYWAYQNKVSNTVYWATADCTGHGVPGALMSMIGTVLLNEAVIIKKVDNPSTILSQLNTYLQRYLNKSDSIYQTQDGMDISCCKLNYNTLELEVASASHTVYVIRDKELIELKGDKITLGQDPYGRQIENFTLQKLQLHKNDIVYTFTDGFPDQVGGPKRKKLKVGVMKQLLIENAHLPMTEQRTILKKEFSEWQGEHPQLDDILVMGIKV